MRKIASFLILSLAVSGAFAEGTSYQQGQSVRKADDQAMTTQRATDITRMIREKIVADDSLSTKAHNIQIITDNNNRVILKGNVDSASEKEKVGSIAKSVAGAAQVINNTVITK
ncbi:BON domain-containing protein [Bdellovibrio sp. HCB274]|uniref:BON domain-containing protein n=1 Tax=Bdellovibrio sp. HCB274 TaxID=3394361 RepID=UPI0039B5E28B